MQKARERKRKTKEGKKVQKVRERKRKKTKIVRG